MASKKTPLQHLANVPLFSSCNSRDLGKIAKASERVTLKAGTIVRISAYVGDFNGRPDLKLENLEPLTDP